MGTFESSYSKYAQKVCKVCDPNHKTGCQLADGFCAYRDLDTLDHSIGIPANLGK